MYNEHDDRPWHAPDLHKNVPKVSPRCPHESPMSPSQPREGEGGEEGERENTGAEQSTQQRKRATHNAKPAQAVKADTTDNPAKQSRQNPRRRPKTPT